MDRLNRSRAIAFCLSLAMGSGVFAQEDLSVPRVTGQKMAEGVEVQLNQIDASDYPRVVLFTAVLREGIPVPGLEAADFRVREDEVDQEPLTVVPKRSALSVVLTLDTSGSMKKRLADAQSAAKSFLATLEPEDKAQVIRFSRDVKTIYSLGTNRAEAEAAIDATVARGDTALWDALHASVETLKEVTGRKAIVLLSDGVDDDGAGNPLSKKTVADVLELAAEVNVPIYAIGLGTELDEVNLRKVASESGARYLNAGEPTELKRLYDSIGKELAGQYTIFYTSDLPADGTEHRLQVKVGEASSTKSFQSPMKVATAPKRDVEEAAPAATPATKTIKLGGRGTLDFQWPGRDFWEIHRDGKDVTPGTPQGSEKVALQAGKYTVRAKFGQPFKPFEIEIRDGETTMIEKGGLFQFRWPGRDFWRVHRDGVNVTPGSPQGTEKIALEAGKYTVQAQFGQPFKPFEIEVRDRETTTIEKGGLFEFRWPGRDFWQVHRDGMNVTPGSPQGTEKIALEAGKYTVKATFGEPFAPFEITIQDGETTIVEP